MSKTTYTRDFITHDGVTRWVVHEHHGGRGSIPIADGEESSRIVAWWKAWRASR